MSNILDSSGHKLATIDDDGIVKNIKSIKVGKVLFNGDVHDNSGRKIGYFEENGYIYDEEARHIGIVHADGRIYDYEAHYIGKVVGEHIESGAAALLLLIR